jgi:hypothetical protein
MENDFGYLSVDSGDKQVLKHLSEMGEQLKKLKEEQLAAEAAADAAKKAYEHFANVVLPGEMYSCGVHSITLASGGVMEVKHNFYCQPNKNAEDRKKIVEWLREHNGGHLVEHDATVSADDMDRLSAADIPYVENTVVNTARLKSFLKEGIGATTGMQQFTIDEIPSCIHFQEVTTVDIKMEA